MRLEPGLKIGERYTLVDRIGAGGMADVWAADDAMLGRRVALKFLHERFAADAQFVERFRREAQSAAGLQHPNVVAVFDRGDFEGRHWIAMEYVEGASLKDLINRGLSVDEAVEIVRQILAGARFAHGRGIIHRDLKPQNVLVDAEGRARVTDFGIARAGPSEITQTGSVLGTAQYLPPEQAQGQDVTASADIYSIGVILYEALTGRVPFDGESAVAIALKQISERPRPPSQINPEVSAALDVVVLRALAKEPANRFASTDEFIDALDTAEADPASGGMTTTQAQAAVAAAAIGAGAVPADADAADGDPGDEEDGDRWLTRNRAIALGLLALALIGGAIYLLTRPGTATVPNVYDKNQADAEQILEDAGFDVFPTTFESCDTPQAVSETDPPAGAEAEQGSTVKIFVSLGLSVQVPDLRGLPEAKAAAKLKRNELLPESRKRFAKDIAPGKVASSDPAAGDKVDCDSVVTMFVSKGKDLIEVPDVLGQQSAAAQSALRQAGFIPNVETEDDDTPENTVIAEDPGAGSTLPRGSEVAITVSTGRGSVVVPDVVGQPEDVALSTLNGRGVTNVRVVKQDTTDKGKDGRVIDQAPLGGTRIRAGERVTIFVGVLADDGGGGSTTTTTATTNSSTTTTTAPPGP